VASRIACGLRANVYLVCYQFPLDTLVDWKVLSGAMRHLTLDQTSQMINATANLRNRLFLTMTYEHGLRVSESIALTRSHVQDGSLCTRPGKRGKNTVQPLSPEALRMWEQVTERLAERTLVFPFTRQRAAQIFHQACDKAGVRLAPRQGIHTLRHSIAHHLLDAGAPLTVVQRQLGHHNLGSTGMYLTVDDAEVARWRAKTLERLQSQPIPVSEG
jgi:integrase/recombinase XerD